MEKPASLTIVDEAMLLLEFSGNNIVINTEENHYKFWTYSVDRDGKLTTYWGRIGKTVQSNEKELGSEYSAKREAIGLVNAKIKKGYRPLNFKERDIY